MYSKVFVVMKKILHFLVDRKMFETDEWDINEDYLKDFNTDDVIGSFNNEKINELEISDNKNKRKSANTSRFEFNCSTFENEPKKVNSTVGLDTSSRKNAFLDIFKNHDNVKTNVPTNNLAMHNINKKIISVKNPVINFERNLVFNEVETNECIVVEKNCMKDTAVAKSMFKYSEETKEINNQLYQNNGNQLKRKKTVAFLDSTDHNSSTKKKCDLISNVLNSTTKETNLIQNCDMLSKTDEINLCSKIHVNDSRKQVIVHKGAKLTRARAPQAVARKFPGPAGLLPDDIDESEVIDLESIDENKNKTNKYIDICSQNTKNLFCTGAWQLMTDDLPANFELCDIATVKENALEYSKDCKKIPYLAGIIQYIDYKPNDPKVILKDLTGKIDARIHHSICKLYPNALGTQVVILVKDVGLIVTSKKYVCLIISLKNLVSLYSDDERLIKTPHLEKLNDNIYNCNLNESQISLLNEHDENSHKENGKSLLVNKQQANDNHQLDDLHNFDFDENDSWLAINVDLNTFKNNQLPSSTPMNSNKINTAVSQSKSTAEVDNDNSKPKTSYKANEKKEPQISSQKDCKLSNNSNLFQTFQKNTKIFVDNKDDSDDEMLSQLDVDAIAASYNR